MMTALKRGLLAAFLAGSAWATGASGATMGLEGGEGLPGILVAHGNGQGNGFGWHNKQLEALAAQILDTEAPADGLAGVVYLNLSYAGSEAQTHRLLAALDYERDELRMWIDPDGTDFDRGGLDTSADIVRSVSGNRYWQYVSEISGPVAPADWEGLTVVPSFTAAAGGAVPEPAALGMAAMSSLLLLRRRR